MKRRPLTDKEIVAHSFTFVLAGYETTANTLSYVSYLLALNPEAQEKLQHEIDSYFEQNPVRYTCIHVLSSLFNVSCVCPSVRVCVCVTDVTSRNHVVAVT